MQKSHNYLQFSSLFVSSISAPSVRVTGESSQSVPLEVNAAPVESQTASLLPNLDDLSPLQARRILEATRQHYRVVDAPETSALGASVTAPSR